MRASNTKSSCCGFVVGAAVEYGVSGAVGGYHTGRITEVAPRGLVIVRRDGDGQRVEFTERYLGDGTREAHLRGTAVYHGVTRLRDRVEP